MLHFNGSVSRLGSIGNKSHRVRRFISVDTQTQIRNQTFCTVSHCLDYKYKIKGGLVIAYTRALRRPPDGNLVYQIARSVLIAVMLMLRHRNERYGDMRSYRPAKVVGGLRCWLHINAMFSTPGQVMMFVSSRACFWGCG
jgi:hypothetical protein